MSASARDWEPKPSERTVLWRKDPDGGGTNRFFTYPPAFLPKLRCLMPCLAETREPDRIWKLVRLLQKPRSACPAVEWKRPVDKEDFLSRLRSLHDPASLEELGDDVIPEIQNIRDPASLDVVTETWDGFSDESRKQLLPWLAATGDLRVVPVLIRTLDSSDSALAAEAAGSLASHFPGAPGVTKALRERWRTAGTNVRDIALRYLAQRDPTPEVERAFEDAKQRLTRSGDFVGRARKAFASGPQEEAKRCCIRAIEDDTLPDSDRLRLADCIGSVLDREETDRYAPVVAPFMERLMGEEDRSLYSAGDVARIAASVRHPAMAPVLLAYLGRRDIHGYSFDPSAYDAVAALCEMGSESRKMGADALLERIQESDLGRIDKVWAVVPLVWMGDGEHLDALQKKILGNSGRDVVNLPTNLRPASEMADEAHYWIDQIGGPPWDRLAGPELNWVVMRRGCLQDARAMPEFLELLRDKPEGMASDPVARALLQLGEPAIVPVESVLRMAGLENPYYTVALRILADSEKVNALPFFRELVRDRPHELSNFVWFSSLYGTETDIALLSPLDDYWKFGRNDPLRRTLAQLRSRFHYNLDGPIR